MAKGGSKERGRDLKDRWRDMATRQTLQNLYRDKREQVSNAYNQLSEDSIRQTLARPIRFLRALCFWLGFANLAIVALVIAFVIQFVSSLPPVDRMNFAELQKLAQVRLKERSTSKKFRHGWVSLSSISRGYLYGIVVSEDATFFEHDGFNFEAILDSLAENIRERKAAFGASTISQQVVKNLFLTNEKTLTRKMKELLITIAMEKRFTKNEILEIYLNIAEFGPEIYGVESAARNYFGRKPQDIDAAQAAFLGLMLPSPKRNYYSIFQNRNLTRVKRRRIERVLRDMLYEEYISEAQYRQYTRYDFFGPQRSLSSRSK